MSNSAINQGVLQAKINNVQNAADSSAVYSAGAWSFKNASAVTSVQIDNSGNVGIGTTSPSHTLVLNQATDTRLRFENAGTAGGQLQLTSNEMRLHAISTNILGLWTNGLERMRIDASGNLLVGTVAGTAEIEHTIAGYRTGGSSAAMNFQNRSTSTACPAFNVIKGSADTTTGHRLATFTVNGGASGAGQINVNGANACAFGSYSDRRLKENIVPLAGELEKVLALNPVEFDYIEGGHQVGFVAQEIEEIYPDAVSILGETDEMKMVTGWDKTTARLVKAIQELSAKVDAQAAEIAALKAS